MQGLCVMNHLPNYVNISSLGSNLRSGN